MSKDKKRKTPPEIQPAVLAPSIVTVNETGHKSFETLYPAWVDVAPREAVMASLPATGAAYFAGGNGSGYMDNGWSVFSVSASGGDEIPLKRILPEERAARYEVLRIMAKDPTIDSAIKMHIANALNSKSDTVESVYIKGKDLSDKENKIVVDLNNVN